jgi:nitroreductase/Pyruvate/2-oxoacid:ferredoxin oxidoreductase delta subunit
MDGGVYHRSMEDTRLVEFDVSKCTRCGLCVQVCVGKVISPETGSVDHANCMRCGHCLAICPEDALSLGGSRGERITLRPVDPEAFEGLVRSRRSLRIFREGDIPRAVIDRILALLAYAPTGTNSRAVGVTVLASRPRVEEFVAAVMGFFMRAASILDNPVLRPFIGLALGRQTARKALSSAHRYLSRYGEGKDILAHGAPCVLVFHAPRGAPTGEQDCIIAATTAALHAETLGLGSCFNGFIVYGLRSNRALRRGIGIPEEDRVYSSLLLGYPGVAYRRVPPREAERANFLKSTRAI